LQALVELLEYRRRIALSALRRARGLEELVRFQSMFNEVQETIDTIEKTQRGYDPPR
jgi:hypothetical protein